MKEAIREEEEGDQLLGPPDGYTDDGIPYYVDDGTIVSVYDGIKRA